MNKIKRRKTKKVKIGNLNLGGNSPIIVQSMTNTQTSNVQATVKQIKELEEVGCELVRISIPDLESAKAISKIKKEVNIPLIADIHFSAELAIESIKQGIDKVRLNPGNFPQEKLKMVVDLAKEKNIPIRIGVNSGSLEKELLDKHGKVTAEAMVESAEKHIKIMEDLGFNNLIIALKASDVFRTIKANKLLAKKVDYPFHLGVTEAGTKFSGTIKSAIGIGDLLLNGIGDTIRISLSSDPVEEVKVAWEILKDLDLRKRGLEVTSCPTCARTNIDVIGLAKEIEEFGSKIKKPLKIAIMGCIVNGPGEAAESDLGVVGTKGLAMILKDGKIINRVEKKDILKVLKKEIEDY